MVYGSLISILSAVTAKMMISSLKSTSQSNKSYKRNTFSFTISSADPPCVNVKDETYGSRVYSVTVEGGIPTTCTCAVAEDYGFPCKHAMAVAMNKPVLHATITLEDDGSTDVTSKS